MKSFAPLVVLILSLASTGRVAGESGESSPESCCEWEPSDEVVEILTRDYDIQEGIEGQFPAPCATVEDRTTPCSVRVDAYWLQIGRCTHVGGGDWRCPVMYWGTATTEGWLGFVTNTCTNSAGEDQDTGFTRAQCEFHPITRDMWIYDNNVEAYHCYSLGTLKVQGESPPTDPITRNPAACGFVTRAGS